MVNGFCFGGANSWLAAAGGHGLAGAVGFYGMPGERAGRPGPTAAAERIRFAGNAALAASPAGRVLCCTGGATGICQRAVRRGRAGLRLGERHDVVLERQILSQGRLAESRVDERNEIAGRGERHWIDDQGRA